MKKGYVLVVIASIILLSSIVLMINKNSFAETDDSNHCLESIQLVVGNEEEVYVKNENNKIDLPNGRYYRQPKSVSNDASFFVGNHNIFLKSIAKNTELEEKEVYYMLDSKVRNKTNKYSVLMNYLINETKFSDNKDEDDHYKQLLILWAMDRLAGYEDDKNYIWNSNYSEPIETVEDTTYEDKFEIDNHSEEEVSYKIYYWKYANNLSVSDKKLLKESDVGNKMLAYLDTWEEYVTWYIEENQQVKLDSITQKDISYQVTNDYIETNLITPKVTGKVYANKFKSYQVEVSTPMIVIDEQGKEKTSFNAGESFRIRVPISKIKDKTLSYSINIKASFSFNSLALYEYPPAARYETPSERINLYDSLYYSTVNRNCVSTKTIDTTLSINYTQQIGNVNIKVIDAKTKENLSNAEIVIYDSTGNIVYKINTTNKETNVTLPVGNYIVKQTVTPSNYQAKTIKQEISITGTGPKEVILENIKLVEVPNLGRQTTGTLMIGGLILISAIILIGYNIKGKKHS